MDWFMVLRIASGVLVVAGYLPYFVQILRKTCAPLNKATCIVWTVFDGLTFFAMIAAGTATLQIAGCAFMNVVLLGLAFRFGTLKWTRIEIACLAIAGVGLLLWLTTGNPLLSMTCSLTAMIVGSVPVMIDAWNVPRELSFASWTLWFISNVLAFSAVPAWEYSHYAQPAGFLLVTTIVYALLWIRPLWLSPRP